MKLTTQLTRDTDIPHDAALDRALSAAVVAILEGLEADAARARRTLRARRTPPIVAAVTRR